MIGFKSFLTEAASTEKLVHLYHPEEEHFNSGEKGTEHALSTLHEVHKTLTGEKSNASITTKYDGSPSVVFGRHPQSGKFFVATKSAFNVNPKINYTTADIDRNHGHAPGLASKLKTLLKHGPKIAQGEGIYQGDMMYTKEDVKDEGGKYHFTPNTITYSANKDSEQGKKIAGAKLGLVVHTSYEGNDINNLKANYNPDLSKVVEHPDVHLISAQYKETPQYDSRAQKTFNKHLNAAADVHNNLTEKGYSKIAEHGEHLKSYINQTVRTGKASSHEGYIDYLNTRKHKAIESVKTDKAKQAKANAWDSLILDANKNKKHIESGLSMGSHIEQAKNVLVKTLSSDVDFEHSINGRKSKPEGYVVTVKNRPLKLVDRKDFSRENLLKVRK